MVFVKDFKKDFYDEVQHQRVLVLVAYDVDALCACKILQYLFQCDQILYTIVPVSGKQDMERAFAENSEGMQHIILVNCGANIDIIETLQPEDNMIFYIADSHRPVDVHNVYNQVQVKLLIKEEDCEEIPEFASMFRDDDESDVESGSESDGTGSGNKRRRFDPEMLERKADRRKWEDTRSKLLFEYAEFSSYGSSSALLLFDMAWKMSKDTNDLLWLSILGVTEQYLHYKVDRDKYIEMVGDLQQHVARLNHRPDDDENAISIDCLKISFENELNLILYRHWSLFESLCHSEYTACKFKLWTMKGKKRLQEFLADMGLPLVQCRQKFTSMDIVYRDGVKDMMAKQFDKYNVSEQAVLLPTFSAHYGYRNKFCASDVVHACMSLLESFDKGLKPSDNFLKAQDILNRSQTEVMDKGLEHAKLQTKAVVNQVHSFIDMHQVISAGPFLYAFVQEGTPDASFFAWPSCLCHLAKFTLEAYCAVSKNKKVKSLPFVIGAPLNSDLGTMLVVGIPPVLDRSLRNCFGKAFEQAASNTRSRTMQDSFDTHIVELKTEDRSKFFDALIGLLQ